MMRRTKKPVVPPSFVAAASNHNYNGSGFDLFLNVAKPAGVAVGDLLLGYFAVQSASIVIGAPSGWALDIGNNSGRLYTHTVAAGDPTQWQWTINSGAHFSGLIAAYHSAAIDVKTFVDESNFPYSGSVGPSVTTTQPNEIVAHFWGFMEGNSTNAIVGVDGPAGTTARHKLRTYTFIPSGIALTLADEAVASPSATPTRTATVDDGSVGGNWAVNPMTIGLKGL